MSMAALERHWYRFTAISLALFPLSLLFCALVWLRRRLYQAGVLRSVRLPVPVIIVGNLTVGGTGKTPLVLWLVELLRSAGYRPGIVTRGYRGTSSVWPLAVTPTTPAELAGDEPVLLARRSGCPVMAGPDRAAAGHELVGQGCDLIVSDDGLQHYRLQRDVEIAVIDGTRRFGNGLCLPAGPLREPVARLREVAFRVTHGDAQPGELAMQLVPQTCYRLDDPGNRVEISHFLNGPVHAVAGIGYPERFFASLRAAGLNIVPHVFPDHHRYIASDIEFDDAHPVIMTEKDAVKCRAMAQPQHWVLAVSAHLPDAFATAVLNRIKEITRG